MGDPHQEAARNTVRSRAAGFAQEIVAGPHRLTSEPVSEGGEIRDFALRSATCGLRSRTSLTVRVYARRKQWPLEMVSVMHPPWCRSRRNR